MDKRRLPYYALRASKGILRYNLYVPSLKEMAAPYEALAKYGGADRDRTGDLMNAIHALYQLSYSPKEFNDIL